MLYKILKKENASSGNRMIVPHVTAKRFLSFEAKDHFGFLPRKFPEEQ